MNPQAVSCVEVGPDGRPAARARPPRIEGRRSRARLRVIQRAGHGAGRARATHRQRSVSAPQPSPRLAMQGALGDMTGDNRVRVCNGCDRPVFNLSEMTRDQAEAVLATRGIKPCVRFYRRVDGTVMTADCPTKVRRSHRLTVITAGALLGAASPAMAEPDPPSSDETPTSDPAPTSDETPPDTEPTNDGATVVRPDKWEMGVIVDRDFDEPVRRPALQWSTWARLGYGVASRPSSLVARSTTPLMPESLTLGEGALGLDVSYGIGHRGDVRLGLFAEARTVSGAVLGGELIVNNVHPYRSGGMGVVLRGGGNGDVFTGAFGFGYATTDSMARPPSRDRCSHRHVDDPLRRRSAGLVGHARPRARSNRRARVHRSSALRRAMLAACSFANMVPRTARPSSSCMAAPVRSARPARSHGSSRIPRTCSNPGNPRPPSPITSPIYRVRDRTLRSAAGARRSLVGSDARARLCRGASDNLRGAVPDRLRHVRSRGARHVRGEPRSPVSGRSVTRRSTRQRRGLEDRQFDLERHAAAAGRRHVSGRLRSDPRTGADAPRRRRSASRRADPRVARATSAATPVSRVA